MEENNQTPAPVQNSTPTEQSPDVQPPPPVQKPNFKLLILAVVVVLLLIASAASAFYLLPKQTKVQTREIVQISPIRTPSPTPPPNDDATANWKTYTNTAIGFSLKLPNDWTTSDCLDRLVFIAPTKETLGICQTDSGGLINIEKELNDFNPNKTPNDKNLTRNEVTINGIKFIRTFGIIEGNRYVNYETSLGGKTFHISYYHYKSSLADYSQVFNQILSTFKFMDSTPTIIPCGENSQCPAGMHCGSYTPPCPEGKMCAQSEIQACIPNTPIIPTPTCMKRPACLDATPRCMIPEPASGWCP